MSATLRGFSCFCQVLKVIEFLSMEMDAFMMANTAMAISMEMQSSSLLMVLASTKSGLTVK